MEASLESRAMEIGSFVKIDGLQSQSAKQHNGKTGVIASRQGEDTGRFCVRPYGMKRGLAIKPNKLTSIDLEDVLETMMASLGQDMKAEDREQFQKERRVELLADELIYKFKDKEFVYDEDEELVGDRYFDLSEVSFHRPDGNVEGKDVQWCLDNGFYQIEDRYWSGDWYFRDNPDLDKQVYAEETMKIRKRNEKRQEYVKAKSKARAKAEQYEEDELMKVLMGDMARMTGRSLDDPDLCRSPRSGMRRSEEQIAHQQRLARTMK